MKRILESVSADIRYALRQIGRSPGFALTVIMTLGIGIAASTAMFTVVDHVLLRHKRSLLAPFMNKLLGSHLVR